MSHQFSSIDKTSISTINIDDAFKSMLSMPIRYDNNPHVNKAATSLYFFPNPFRMIEDLKFLFTKMLFISPVTMSIKIHIIGVIYIA
jgi:hypothetical protein